MKAVAAATCARPPVVDGGGGGGGAAARFLKAARSRSRRSEMRAACSATAEISVTTEV